MFLIQKNIFVLLFFSSLTFTACHSSLDLKKDTLILQNKEISVVFFPALGGKIISIKDKNENEFLSRSKRKYKRRRFGMKYEDTEFDGIDECFPSMGQCAYPAKPYKGKTTGDHGEICHLPWEVVSTSTKESSFCKNKEEENSANVAHALTMRVKGVNFSYIFTRKATLEGKSLILDYTVQNTGIAPLYHSYVFHPLFKGETGCLIDMKPETEIKLLCSKKSFLGKIDSKIKLASIKDKQNRFFYKNMFIENSNRYYKFIVGKLKKGEAVLRYKNGTGLKLTWSEEKMPYMAVWCSEGAVRDLYHLAPEPAVSQFDTLEQAYNAGEARVIPGLKTEKWRITLTLIN